MTNAEGLGGNYTAAHALAWSEVAAPPPSFGSGGGMVANSSSGVAVTFGGVSGGGLVNSTFAYTEATDRWSVVSSPRAPTPRSDFAFAFDPATGAAILFGGLTNLTTLSVSNETWTYSFSSAQWSRGTSGPAPPAREAPAFAIVPSLGVGILYGGWNRNYSMTGSLTYSDLWELNLSTGAWSNLSVSGPRPPPLEGATMAWDPTTGTLDLFGGCYPCSSAVWQLHPTPFRWTALAPAPVAPAPRAAASWTYDPVRDADLLFGGTNGATAFNDTEVFSAANDSWVAETPSFGPSARSSAAAAFLDVPDNETWLLAGGQSGPAVAFSDLWRLSATANVSLRVVNASSPDSPLAGAEVNLSGERVGSTDSAGYLNLTQVNVVGTALNVTDVPWFSPANETAWLPPGRPANWTVPLVPEPLGTVGLAIIPGASGLSSAVWANLSVDGVPIEGVSAVTSGNYYTTTFQGVPPGTANVTVEAASWRTASVQGTLSPGGSLNLTVTIYPDPVLTVLVLGTLPGGSPLPLTFAQLFLNGTFLGYTDPQGSFTTVTSALGLQELRANVSGFLPATEYVAVPYTGSVRSTMDLTSQPFALLAVTVLRVNDNLPIADAAVFANTTVPLAFGAYQDVNLTDVRGTTSLSLPAGGYSVSAGASNYLSSPPVVVHVVPGPNAPLTIHLLPIPPANLTLIVRNRATGNPVAGANVSSAGGSSHGQANGWGYYNATNLTPGLYTFFVSAPAYLTNVTFVTLASRENRTLIVNLTPLPGILEGASGWEFALFPGSWDQLWPFLLIPFFLVVGGFVFASVLRGLREEEPAPGIGPESALVDPAGLPGRTDRAVERSSEPPH